MLEEHVQHLQRRRVCMVVFSMDEFVEQFCQVHICRDKSGQRLGGQKFEMLLELLPNRLFDDQVSGGLTQKKHVWQRAMSGVLGALRCFHQKVLRPAHQRLGPVIYAAALQVFCVQRATLR